MRPRHPQWEDEDTQPIPVIRSHRKPPLVRVQPKPLLTALAAIALAGLVVGLVPTRGEAAATSSTTLAGNLSTPVTAMFSYDESFRHANDHYHPSVPFDSDDPASVRHMVNGMRYAGMAATVASWWGPGQHGETSRFPILYQQANLAGLAVIPYYEPEAQSPDPTVARIQSDLAYLGAYADAYPSAGRINGLPVIFVYNAGSTGCAEVTKWKQATNGFTSRYVNMKVFPGYKTCPDQPSSWHQYGPATAESNHLPYSTNISPGFWHHDEATPRLVRDPARWALNVQHLAASTAQWRLVTSYNEWGEATSVESSPTWASASGWGTYLDELHDQLGGPAPSPSPSVTVSPSPTATPSPTGTTSPPCPIPTTSSPAPSPSTTTSPPAPSPTSSPPAPSPSPTAPPGSVTVLAAGDIVCANCTGLGSSSGADGYTARLLARYPGAVIALGDNQYEEGTRAQYEAGWGRSGDSWGDHLSRVYPAPGNHEWLTANAQGYRDYFAARLASIGSDTASPNPQLYYSWDYGAWHFISLDSDCGQVGGCSAGRPMTNWLLADLAANDGRPTLVYYHHATWSSGSHGSRTDHEYLKSVMLADTDVQLVLAGHDHVYERFNPMGQSGPQANGIRYFTVGTGGKNHTTTYNPVPGSVVFNSNTFGVLKLSLAPTGYSWEFLGIDEVGASGNAFADEGSSGLRSVSATVSTPVSQTASARVFGLAWGGEPLAVTAGRKLLRLIGVGS